MLKNIYFFCLLLTMLPREPSCQYIHSLDNSVYENNFLKYMIQNESEFNISDSTLYLVDSLPAFNNFCPLLNAFKERLDIGYKIKCDSIEFASAKSLIIRKDISNRIKVIQKSEVNKNELPSGFLSIKFAKKIKYKNNIYLFVSTSSFDHIKKQFIVKFDHKANVLKCYFSITID